MNINFQYLFVNENFKTTLCETLTVQLLTIKLASNLDDIFSSFFKMRLIFV